MPPNPRVFHEDSFFEYFKPRRVRKARYDIWGGLGLETFGEDFETVRRQDPRFVWTVVDGDSGSDQWIVPGVHFVNRVCYLVTELPHNWITVDFRISRRMTSLTPLGLRRQISRLEKLIAQSRAAAPSASH
jgi:hypothetical protein